MFSLIAQFFTGLSPKPAKQEPLMTGKWEQEQLQKLQQLSQILDPTWEDKREMSKTIDDIIRHLGAISADTWIDGMRWNNGTYSNVMSSEEYFNKNKNML